MTFQSTLKSNFFKNLSVSDPFANYNIKNLEAVKENRFDSVSLSIVFVLFSTTCILVPRFTFKADWNGWNVACKHW